MISEIILKNFKCYKEERITLESVNLLTGINGMGKSTVIQSLLLLRQSHEQNALNKGLVLNGELVNIGTGRDLLYENAEKPEIIEISLKDEKNDLQWEFEYDFKSDFLKKVNREDDSNLLFIKEKVNDIIIDSINVFTKNFEYICAERIGPRNIYPKSYYTVTEKNQLGIMGEYTEHYLLVHGDNKIPNDKAKYEGIENLALRFQVQGWLNEISPGMGFNIEDYVNADSVGLRYRSDDKIPNEYRPSNVGFGITYVLPVIVALLKASSGDLLIIENPEAHLHPQGQRKIGELISKVASGGVQVIIETHSDHILNGIRLSVRKGFINKEKVKIHYFEKVKENGEPFHRIVSPSVKDDGRLTFWPEGFFDEWDKALDELF